MSIQEPALTDLSRYPGFRSSKNQISIHYPRRWQRDALIQAALDPSVSAMSPLAQKAWPPRAEFGFTVTIAGTDFACIIGDVPGTRLLSPNLPILRLPRQALLAEPLFSTSRAVWSRKRLTIDPVIRFQVLEMASFDISGVPAGEIIATIDSAPNEPVDILLAMLAQGYLTGHLGSGLTGKTLIRPGSNFESRNESTPRERLHSILSGG